MNPKAKTPPKSKSAKGKNIRGALALVGGNEFTKECTFDAELIKSSAESKNIAESDVRVLIVPTAAAYENPAKIVQQGRSYFENLNVGVDVLEIYTRTDATEIDSAKLAEQLQAACIIYLTSGSPMHLQSVLAHTAVFDEIKSAWQGGAVLVGAGAGGDVLCDYMVDARGGAFTVGLNLISEISMIPGYDLWSEDKIHRTVQLAPPDIFVAGVPLQTALISKAGEAWQEMGLGKVSAFAKGEKVAVADLPIL